MDYLWVIIGHRALVRNNNKTVWSIFGKRHLFPYTYLREAFIE